MMKPFQTVAMTLMLPFALAGAPALAGDATVDAAVGGAIGGAVGGAVGERVGGRDGAVIGAGIGAATGSAIATDRDRERYHDGHRYDYDRHDRYDGRYAAPGPAGRFCPPGQAKKGRC